MDIERKIVIASDLKVLEEGNGVLEGYATIYGAIDKVNERTVRGCFDNCLPAFLENGFISWGHNWTEPVGFLSTAGSDDVGFKFSAPFHGTPDAQEARQWVKERKENGKSVGLSIGYRVVKSEVAEDGVRDLIELELYEVAIVTVPCLPSALVTSAKSSETLEDHSETVLATVREFTTRLKSLSELRSKEGRTLSDANRERLKTHADALRACAVDLGALLMDSEPKADTGDVQGAIARYAQTMGRLAGYPVNAQGASK